MGWGDEIMVTGEAVRLGCSMHKPLVVLGNDGKPRWHEIWAGNMRIFRPGGIARFPTRYEQISNHNGWRPYLVYSEPRWRKQITNQTDTDKASSKARWIFHPTWRATPGELYLPVAEPGEYVIVEPNIKRKGNPNKQWPFEKWQALVNLCPEIDFVQLGGTDTRLLDGTRLVVTRTFQSACTALSGALAAVLPEGGLHHAAAALGVPSVVLFGAATSAFNTGYLIHHNITDGEPCGQRQPCHHCERYWADLDPRFVAHRLREALPF